MDLPHQLCLLLIVLLDVLDGLLGRRRRLAEVHADGSRPDVVAVEVHGRARLVQMDRAKVVGADVVRMAGCRVLQQALVARVGNRRMRNRMYGGVGGVAG